MFGGWRKGEGQKRLSALAAAPLQEIENYWQSLRRLDGPPSRADVDPGGMERSLRHAFVLERIAPGVARVRVAGQVVSGFLGTDAKGLPFSFGFEMTSRPLVAGVLQEVFDTPVTARLILETAGRSPCPCEVTLLPLSGRDGRVTRILGGIAFEGTATPQGRRLRLITSSLSAISRIPAQSPAAAPMKDTGVPHLRLVVDNQ